MDLFIYLMAKNGNNSSVHGDLFSYLLGKGQSQTQTISGTTIYIPNAKKLVSLIMTKESTQATSILPSEYTQVDYIKSSKTQYINTNYYTKSNTSIQLTLKFDNIGSASQTGFLSSRNRITSTNSYIQLNFGTNLGQERNIYIWTQENQATNYAEVGTRILSKNTLSIKNTTFSYGDYSKTILPLTDTSTVPLILFGSRSIGSNTPLPLSFYEMYVYDFKIYESDVLVKHYIPCYRNSDNEVGLYEIIDGEFFTNQGTGAFTYGSVATIPNPDYPVEVKTVKGSVDVYVSNGETTNTYTINLGNNELVGIGDYKDELLVDSKGHVFINKKTGKHIFSNNDTFSTAYSSLTRTGFVIGISDMLPYTNPNQIPSILTTKFIPVSMNATWKSGNVSMVNYANLQKNVYFFLEANKTIDDIKNVLVGEPLYYVLETPELIDLQTTVDLSLFKGANTITNSEDGYMTIQYR